MRERKALVKISSCFHLIRKSRDYQKKIRNEFVFFGNFFHHYLINFLLRLDPMPSLPTSGSAGGGSSLLPPLMEVVDNIVHEEEEDEEDDAFMDPVDQPPPPPTEQPVSSSSEEPKSEAAPPPLDNSSVLTPASLSSIEERLDRALSEVGHLNVDNLRSSLSQSLVSGGLASAMAASSGGGTTGADRRERESIITNWDINFIIS